MAAWGAPRSVPYDGPHYNLLGNQTVSLHLPDAERRGNIQFRISEDPATEAKGGKGQMLGAREHRHRAERAPAKRGENGNPTTICPPPPPLHRRRRRGRCLHAASAIYPMIAEAMPQLQPRVFTGFDNLQDEPKSRLAMLPLESPMVLPLAAAAAAVASVAAVAAVAAPAADVLELPRPLSWAPTRRDKVGLDLVSARASLGTPWQRSRERDTNERER